MTPLAPLVPIDVPREPPCSYYINPVAIRLRNEFTCLSALFPELLSQNQREKERNCFPGRRPSVSAADPPGLACLVAECSQVFSCEASVFKVHFSIR